MQAPRSLSTSADRRSEVAAAAVQAFAHRGFYGTTTTEVAGAAGVSQAYLYKLYPDKAAMFVAALDHCSDTLAVLLTGALRGRGGQPDDITNVLRDAARAVSEDRSLTRLLLHASGASSEPAIAEAVRRCYAKQFEVLTSHSSATAAQVRTYFADGMLSNVMHTIEAHRSRAPWATVLSG